ncbi:hypothetical protein ACIGXM_16050 [Kitasatospora sp. NPDC052896]|uniref:hypothetical protein n=1 Tax=Kitasatospora sp. NPDC052896 TaxID=3364061 RepID=UPI0037CAD26D
MTLISLIAVAVLAVVSGFALAVPRVRTRRLRGRFGAEYDRVVLRHAGDVRAAEDELTELLDQDRRRVPAAMPAADRERAAARLQEVQELFVEDPVRAVAEADRLLNSILDHMGWAREERLAALSAGHAACLPGYRAARAVMVRVQGAAVPTEELRMALVAVAELIVAVLREEPAGPVAKAGPRWRGVRPGRRPVLVAQWSALQRGFVDDPRDAVRRADDLVGRALGQLGPADFGERRGELRTLAEGPAPSTEQLRLAMRDYRSMLDRLLAC